MLNRKSVIQFPYETEVYQEKCTPKTILINAVGFGGNAVSIIVQKTD
jgi:3-oxoacyl-(acyl-carrier-protein) synthase